MDLFKSRINWLTLFGIWSSTWKTNSNVKDYGYWFNSHVQKWTITKFFQKILGVKDEVFLKSWKINNRMDINNLKKLFNFWQFFPIRNTIKLATTYSIYLKGNRDLSPDLENFQHNLWFPSQIFFQNFNSQTKFPPLFLMVLNLSIKNEFSNPKRTIFVTKILFCETSLDDITPIYQDFVPGFHVKS